VTLLFRLFVLLILFLLVAVIFINSLYERKNKQTKFPRKDLLLGFDSFKKGSWSSSSMTKGTEENPLQGGGESHDQDAFDKMFRPRTEEGVEKKAIKTILVEEDNPEGSPRRKGKNRGIAK
jgi:hypothetical protein